MPEVTIRGWLLEEEQLLLRKLAFGASVLELGAYEGLSTINMAATATEVHSVDTFDGRATPDPRDTESEFRRNIEQAAVDGKVFAFKGTTEDILPALERGKYGLIFIDCDHSYESVKRDIELSLPLLAEGGTLAFHDYDEGHPGVVGAVDEITGDFYPISQADSLVALKRRPAPGPTEVQVYLTMPHRDMHCSLGAAQGLHFASRRIKHIVSNFGTSVLTHNFNTLLCEALNARKDGITHFAMLHNDVIPAKDWLDVLLEEMLAGGYDMISAVVPMKNAKGLTSCGLETVGNPWVTRRLTIREVFDLPETFSAKDIPFREGQQGLLLNTGCWMMRIDQPWIEGLHFRQQDRIAWSMMENRYAAQSISEDWDLSRQLTSRGARIAATRKVALCHERPEFHNKSVWGDWDHDHDYAENERKVAEYEASQ